MPRLHDERRELSDLVGKLRRVFRQIETLLVGRKRRGSQRQVAIGSRNHATRERSGT